MTGPSVGVTISGGELQGIVGAGSVVIENATFYNRAPEEPSLAASAEPIGSCPYPGLAYFGPNDTDLFFGRDATITRLAEAVDRHCFTALVGASGSGKSSVVLAGLAPRLHGDREHNWRFSHFRIGNELESNPFLALARALVPLYVASDTDTVRLKNIKQLAGSLQGGDLTLRDVFADCRSRNKGRRILLIADQFEEVFTLVKDDAIRNRFIDVLLGGFPDPPANTVPDICLILTMRADFYGQALGHRLLAHALQNHVENLGPMDGRDLRSAIICPADKCGVSFESGLVEILLDEVESKPGGLPLLQFALREMWGRQERMKITRKSYEDIGGFEGALAQRADIVFARLTRNGADAQTEIGFQRLFTRLVTPGEGQEDTRRVVERAELGDQVWGLAQRLAGEDNRLVVTNASSSRETVEVVHEALIRRWPKLVEWINRDRVFQIWLRQIKSNMEVWWTHSDDEGPLLRGGMLAQAQDWLDKRRDDLSLKERAYVEASIALNRRLEAEKETARQAEVAKTKSAQINYALMVAGLSMRETDAGRPERGLLLALAVDPESPLGSDQFIKRADVPALTAAAERAIYGGVYLRRYDHHCPVLAASFSPDGRHLVTASDDGTVRLWDAESGQWLLALTPHQYRVRSVSFSPDGRRIVTASDDTTARVWDAKTGQELHVLIGHQDWVASASFSPEGSCIVTASGDQTVRFWDAESGQELHALTGLKDRVMNASFSPDGGRIVTAFVDKTAVLWDVKTGHELHVLTGHKDRIWTASFSPDGRRIVTASDDRTARIWDAESGQELHPLTGHLASVCTASFSPDGRRIVTASSDHTARFWDASTGQELHALTGHLDSVYSASFSRDGRRVVTASNDTTARLWDAENGQELCAFTGHQGGVLSASFSPNGRMVTASYDGTARIWDAESGRELSALIGHSDSVRSASFSADGRRIVTVLDDGTARFWDAEKGQRLHALIGPPGQVFSASFSTDGRRVVTTSLKDMARIWDAESGHELCALIGHSDSVRSASFSIDGRYIVTASEDKTARLWDAETGQELHALTGHRGGVLSASFSPDGRRIVTASKDRTARLWDTEAGQELYALTGHQGAVVSASFSPDGGRIVTASDDRTARLWDAESGKELHIFIGHQGWLASASFSPDGRRIVTTSGDRTARLWAVFPALNVWERAHQRKHRDLTKAEEREFYLKQ